MSFFNERFNLKHKIILPTLIFLFLRVYSSFAQNVNEFKLKSTNITDGRIGQNQLGDWNEEKSYKKKRESNSSTSSKIRLRFLTGTYSSDQKNATNTTNKIIWDRFGFGQSTFKSEGNRTDYKYDIENKFIGLSYTFGDEYTFTLGGRSVINGEINITSSENIEYSSTKVYGSGYFWILGIEFGMLEILWGYEYFRYAFIEFDTESTSGYWGNFEDYGGQYNFGIGLVF